MCFKQKYGFLAKVPMLFNKHLPLQAFWYKGFSGRALTLKHLQLVTQLTDYQTIKKNNSQHIIIFYAFFRYNY